MKTNKPTFAIIGVAGYIAPKHLQAIKEIDGILMAAVDPNDNVELLDEYFPKCEFFKTTNEFETYLKSKPVDYVVICSPTHLHYSQLQLALQNGSHAICESPLVLHNNEIKALKEIEIKTGKKIIPVLQYRFHPEIIKLKQLFENEKNKIYQVELINHTYRGKWFSKSWKGDPSKSGGLLTSLGYHFFESLIWIFGQPTSITINESSTESVKGILTLKNAVVNFSLGISFEHENFKLKRELVVNQTDIDLSGKNEESYFMLYNECLSGVFTDINTMSDIQLLFIEN